MRPGLMSPEHAREHFDAVAGHKASLREQHDALANRSDLSEAEQAQLHDIKLWLFGITRSPE